MARSVTRFGRPPATAGSIRISRGSPRGRTRDIMTRMFYIPVGHRDGDYTAVCDREGGWWVVSVPELEAGRVTQARTLDEVPETAAGLIALMTGKDPADITVSVYA